MTLVLCLGNDVLRDDGVGWTVAGELERGGMLPPGVDVRRSAVAGFYLLDELTGYDRAVVVDAIRTGAHEPGTVLSFPFDALRTEQGPSPHAVGLPTVIRLGRQSGVPLPGQIHIVAMEVEDMETVEEGLTPRVAAAVPDAVAAVRAALVTDG
jgi:hydrogenase maturation protease